MPRLRELALKLRVVGEPAGKLNGAAECLVITPSLMTATLALTLRAGAVLPARWAGLLWLVQWVALSGRLAPGCVLASALWARPIDEKVDTPLRLLASALASRPKKKPAHTKVKSA